MKPKSKLWVDVGGTFTDAILWSAESLREGVQLQTIKVLSSGLVRCAFTKRMTDRKFILKNLPTSCAGFWRDCRISALIPGSASPWTAVVSDSGENWLEFDSGIPTDLLDRVEEMDISITLHTGKESPLLAAHLLLNIPLNHSLPPLTVRLGTTRGTNTLLTRTGASVGICLTKGFADLPWIGTQDRPDLFALNVIKPAPLCRFVTEVQERLTAQGDVLLPLDTTELRATFARWKISGVRAVVIALMHSYLNPEHEHTVARLAQEYSFDEVICSADISPVRKIVSRAETASVDGYLSPIIRDYLQKIEQTLNRDNRSDFEIMTSAGSLVPAEEFRGKDSVLSGPAGGVVAVQALLQQLGLNQALAFDMGGTSTDVSRCSATHLPLQFDTRKAGVRIVTPILSIHTVAAGGGSICSFDGVQLRVGPASAGSYPGPACYGQGGPLTITDINVLLGIIPPEAFPFPLDLNAAQQRLNEIATSIRHTLSISQSDLMIAEGFRKLANQCMADAIAVISTRQGADPRDHVLVGFGGAAGQHQCDLAECLGITNIIDPPLAGLFSAAGIGLAQHKRFAALPVYQPLSRFSWAQHTPLVESVTDKLQTELSHLGYDDKSIIHTRHFELRYVGTEATLLVAAGERDDIALLFAQAHQLHFGYTLANREVEVCVIRLEAQGIHKTESWPTVSLNSQPMIPHRLWCHEGWQDCWLQYRRNLPINTPLTGPGVVISQGHTTLIAHGWTATLEHSGILRIVKSEETPKHILSSQPTVVSKQIQPDESDPIFRDILAQRLATIADSMGEILERTAISVNIKERRDFSCAIFDSRGYLIANAPHVPVHLGAMGQTVRQLLHIFPEATGQDVLLTNDPNRGGSHLPDITVVSPVDDPSTGQRAFVVACRAHHAEIGGIAAGSMPPMASNLEQEGVLLRPQYLIKDGVLQAEIINRELLSARFPSRSPKENLADLQAQIAANRFGSQQILELISEHGTHTLNRVMHQIMAASAEHVQQWIDSLPTTELYFEDQLDDGHKICVRIHKSQATPQNSLETNHIRWQLHIDFTGTSATHPKNFNANPAIVTAALLYVIRLLAGDELPLNEGALRDIDLIIPRSFLNPLDAGRCDSLSQAELPAVAAGNVETSQRIVDVLLGAFDAAAASQGTMNNFLFGDNTFGYYETICGGTGATAHGPGCDAVHSHMTNTRITDPEILELRYPVRLVEFAIRPNSGGAGEYRGGNGVIRTFEFLAPVQCSLLSSRRSAPPPYGLHGGSPGALGENILIRCGGVSQRLPGTSQLDMYPGDKLSIRTPGGGGWGSISSIGDESPNASDGSASL